MRIPEHKIEEVRLAANIVDTISTYVQLKKRGKNFIGLCPFHQEKTPSFTVSEDKQIFHCFGCHAGGNVFKFLMEFKRISFIESVKEIADQNGISIEYDEQAPTGEQTEQEILYDINVQAAHYFSDNLLKSSEGDIAREYFKNRNIKNATMKSFGLGYAREGWDSFIFFANENKIDLEKAKILGLVDTKDSGGYYDKLRGRIIFPILSPNGRVIAFGGRILDNTAKAAKYLNSPESKIYQKRYSLYGLFHSQDEIRRHDKAILVEGYMDLISLYQGGIKNVVASSGTALTPEQVQLLSRYTKNIVVMFDADTAGQKAAMRSIEILLKQNFDVKVLSLPEGEDPDSFINKFGKDIFEEKLKSAMEFLEYQTSQFEKNGMLKEAATQTHAIRQLVQTAALVDDALKRSLLIKNISKKFNLREKLLESELNKYLDELNNRNQRSRQQFQPPVQREEVPVQQKPINTKTLSVEKELIKLLFSGNESIIGYIFDHALPEEFQEPNYSRIAAIIFDLFKKDIVAPAVIIENFEDEELKTFLLNLTVAEESISKKWDELSASGKISTHIERQTIDAVIKFRTLILDSSIKRLTMKIGAAENDEARIELMRESKELQNEKLALIHNKSSIRID